MSLHKHRKIRRVVELTAQVTENFKILMSWRLQLEPPIAYGVPVEVVTAMRIGIFTPGASFT